MNNSKLRKLLEIAGCDTHDYDIEPRWIKSKEASLKLLSHGKEFCELYQEYLDSCEHEYTIIFYSDNCDEKENGPFSFDEWYEDFTRDDEDQ